MGLFKVTGLLAVGMLIGYSLTLLSNEGQGLSDKRTQYIERKLTNEQHSDLALVKAQELTVANQMPCPHQNSQLSKDETNSVSEITSIIKINSSLKQKYKILEQELRQSEQKIKSLNRQIGELDESDVTDKELLALVPKDYENLVVNFRGQTRDEIFDFHHQPEDLDKGFDLSHNISSFIVSHAYSFGVELNSVVCKKSFCELLINEKERPSWDRIYHDMTRQEWWGFNSTNSSSTTDEDGNIFIYYFMSIQPTKEE
ncbi:MAG: hypothetical protein OQK09_01315 [Colwellia sp.]|nr:hypothetical protein [Colwellia sp.]MCW8865684.1 hypothetical protein [Colwellia sp.]MCW9080128.1 hypothetical protein [Colwellia sp.]